MPYQPVKPLETPVRLTFPDRIELISSVDPVTNLHSVHCGLCGKLIKLGQEIRFLNIEIKNIVEKIYSLAFFVMNWLH
jgi:hypothetical protein